ncbi:MAG: PIG-L family deacetylase [SAR202 cluster bacterium]|nr:PIG-L domain-containing protein [Chloroflexota bacterium]MQF94604.1 PIG-L family deacetylase [SAR202 cluster bacterium]MQG33460.1 PIG-L family deacetylase [SAR202 cluster bacterium]HCP23673.1 PIG-L family deacetylase [Dehalococcoidia bacterium]|tara:strand:+ start:2311 stop:3054 length:744 start_codon:yes stop_codon:yes gene_type:complete
MEILTTAPKRAMAVTPHPDDCEGGCGATLSKWIHEFGTVGCVVMCTNGNKGTGDREMTPERLAATRVVEQKAASDIVGIDDVVFLAHPDGGLEDSELFRSQVTREIRRFKPDLILCIDPYRSVSHTHRDHRKSGQVALDAAFTYAWSYQHFPEQITEEGLEPHRVEQALMWGTEEPDVFVDIRPYLDVKVDSLGAHASQMSSTREERLERIKNNSSRHKEETGLEYAEAFRRITFNLGSLDWQMLHR